MPADLKDVLNTYGIPTDLIEGVASRINEQASRLKIAPLAHTFIKIFSNGLPDANTLRKIAANFANFDEMTPHTFTAADIGFEKLLGKKDH